MPFVPTADQQNAIARMAEFVCASMRDTESRQCMILRGYAGTGKTSVAKALIAAMAEGRRRVVLLAPTGRAAKVLAMGTGHTAFTIHRFIYRQQRYLSEHFSLNNNLHHDTLFIADEASMINHGADTFGSGSLLDDLVGYVMSGRRCSLMLIGDTAQLPPIGFETSPALESDRLRGYGLYVTDYDMTEVLRQAADSGILANATMLRNMKDSAVGMPRIRTGGFKDISVCIGNELVETLAGSYSRQGMDETVVITRSNKRANMYNAGIRNQILGRESELESGDMLMIVKNNYYWTHDIKDPAAPPFLANGDRCVVRRVRNIRSLYGFRFADVLFTLPDYDDYEIQATMLLDTLQSESPALSAEKAAELMTRIETEDYADITRKDERRERLRDDKHFNALQVKYAYAVTCHKAQGGQWADVYLDQGYVTPDMLSTSYIRWLYTAFTRPTSHLFLVNWPKEQTEGEE